MKISDFQLAYLIVACLPSFLLGLHEIPDSMPRERYCIGCEYSVKALHGMMNEEKLTKDNMVERVSEVLDSLCTEDKFKGAEYPAKSLLKACEFLIEKNGELLNPLLVNHYTHLSGGSYFDLSQLICQDVSKACEGVSGHKRYPEHLDAGVEFDEKINNFRVKHGEGIKLADPKRAKDDL